MIHIPSYAAFPPRYIRRVIRNNQGVLFGCAECSPYKWELSVFKVGCVEVDRVLATRVGGGGLLACRSNPGAIKTRITENASEIVRRALPYHLNMAGDAIAWFISERREWLGGRYEGVDGLGRRNY